MPAIIDSAPDCISKDPGRPRREGEDSLDFVMGDPYADCAGFMTFGPGSTYGEEGAGAETAYMLLTWIGIIVMVAVIIAWIVYENQAPDRIRARAPRPHPRLTAAGDDGRTGGVGRR